MELDGGDDPQDTPRTRQAVKDPRTACQKGAVGVVVIVAVTMIIIIEAIAAGSVVGVCGFLRRHSPEHDLDVVPKFFQIIIGFCVVLAAVGTTRITSVSVVTMAVDFRGLHLEGPQLVVVVVVVVAYGIIHKNIVALVGVFVAATAAAAAAAAPPSIGSPAAVAGDWTHTDEWDEKARLPHGITEIRQHLNTVDDVPLLVKLFTNSSPSTVRDMLHVMQDHGEIVCVVGSGMRIENAPIFQDADVSIAVDCFPTNVARLHPDGDVSMLQMNADDLVPKMNTRTTTMLPGDNLLAASSSASVFSVSTLSSAPGTTHPPLPQSQVQQTQLHPVTSGTLSLSASVNTMQCSLTFVEGCSIYVTVDIVAEARRLLSNIEGSLLLMRTVQLLLVVILVLANVTSLPGSPLSTLQLLWLLWAVTPVLALTMVDAAGVDHMQQMVPKNTYRAIQQRKKEHEQHTVRTLRTQARNASDAVPSPNNADLLHSSSSLMHKKNKGCSFCSFCSLFPPIEKDIFSKKDMTRFATFALIRVLPSAFASLLVYCWTFVHTMEEYYLPNTLLSILNNYSNTTSGQAADATAIHGLVYLWTKEPLLYTTHAISTTNVLPGDVLEYVQTRCRIWVMSFIVWCLIFIVFGLEKRTSYLVFGRCNQKICTARSWCSRCSRCSQCNSQGKRGSLNRSWLMASMFFLCLQAVACIAVDVSSPLQPIPPLGLALFALCWPLIIVVLDEFVKKSDRKRRQKIRQRLRIGFDTKLGMWSPR